MVRQAFFVDRRLSQRAKPNSRGGNLELRVPTSLPARIPSLERPDDYLRSVMLPSVTLLVFLLSAGLFLSPAILSLTTAIRTVVLTGPLSYAILPAELN